VSAAGGGAVFVTVRTVVVGCVVVTCSVVVSKSVVVTGTVVSIVSVVVVVVVSILVLTTVVGGGLFTLVVILRPRNMMTIVWRSPECGVSEFAERSKSQTRRKPSTPTTAKRSPLHGIGGPTTGGRPRRSSSSFAAQRARRRAIQDSGLRASSGAI